MSRVEAMNAAIEEWETASRRFAANVRSGILAGEFDQDYLDEVLKLQAFLKKFRARLYQVLAKTRVTGRTPLCEDLVALLDSLDVAIREGGRDGLSCLSAPPELRSVK